SVDTMGATLCNNESRTLRLTGKNLGYWFRYASDKTPVVPKVELKRDFYVAELDARFIDEHKLDVDIPDHLETGSYDLEITRTSDQAQVVLSGAIAVLPTPTVTRIEGGTLCIEGGTARTIVVHGSGLNGPTVSLDDAADAPIVTSSSSDQMTLQLP